ncbi:MAG TPA: hypothetical protein VFU81_22935 [Thermomicrobiales bacterium]|nr:hypothetical protein [Thermomicrobiales bacterium]
MEGSRFDGLIRDAAAAAANRRQLAFGLAVGLATGAVVMPMAHEAAAAPEAAGGNCGHGRHHCHGKCCPRRGPVCCKKGCCKKHYHCCNVVGIPACCRK